MSATTATTTVLATTSTTEVPTVPTVPITTAAILHAAKGKGYAKQLKNKMEKTKTVIVGNTSECYTVIKDLYSHSVMLLQQSLFQTENTTSGEEYSTSVGKFMDCIETLSGSIQKNIASLKKLKQKLAQGNKQYIEQTATMAAIPVEEPESVDVSTATKKPRAKKVKETSAALVTAPTATEGETATAAPAAATAPKKPRAKKVNETTVEPAPTETAPMTTEGEMTTATTAPAPAKKSRAKKVKETTAATTETVEPAAEPAVEPAAEPAAEPAVEPAAKKPAAKKTKKANKSSDPVTTDVVVTIENTDSEQPVYTVIHPEVTEDVPKKSKEPKKTNKSKQTAEPIQVVEPIESISNIPQDDFIPLEYEINSEDLCRDIEMIIDELEEDLISEITDFVSLK